MSAEYIVLKQRDVETCLVQCERDQLKEICGTIEHIRFLSNEPPVKCMVIESHHPMYAAVRQIVEAYDEKVWVKA